MELRHLRYFVSIADHGSFTRAAEALGIAQPPLSQQIRRLEQELGVVLFRRLTRSVQLTEMGAALLDQARDILSLQRQFVASAEGLARGERGHLRVGIAGAVAMVPVFPAAVRRFREAWPLVEIALEQSNTPALCTALNDRTLDIAIIRPPVPELRGLSIQALFREPTMVALPSGHPLGELEAVPLGALADDPLIMFPRALGPGFHDAILSACNSAGFSPRVGQIAPHIDGVVPLVAAGLGVSVVPESLSQIHAVGVSFKAIDGAAPMAELAIACRSEVPQPLVARFMTILKQTVDRSGGEAVVSSREAPP